MKPFVEETARVAILARLARAGAKGTLSLCPASAAEPKRALFAAAAAALEREEALFADRRKAKPRWFAWQHRPLLPTMEEVAARMEKAALAAWPSVATRALWKTLWKARRDELPLLEPALQHLLAAGRLLRLEYRRARGTEELFIPAHALPAPIPATRFSPEAIRRAYATLAERTGFPAVAISHLARESEAPLPELKAWLAGEHREGRAILSRGDWSLADEDKRLAAVDWQGQAYLLVRLLP